MSPEEERERLMARVREANIQVGRDLEREKSLGVARYRTIMQNLSLMSGAFAAATLLLLGYSIPKIDALLIMGAVILMIETVWGFVYVLRREGEESKELKNEASSILGPLSKMMTLYFDAQDGKITWEQFDTDIRPLHNHLVKAEVEAYKPEVIDTSFETDKSEVISMALLVLGMLLVVLGLVFPYLC